MEKIRSLMTVSEAKLRSVCEKLGIPAFHVNEITFISEFCAVLKPVATALDILQAEKRTSSADIDILA